MLNGFSSLPQVEPSSPSSSVGLIAIDNLYFGSYRSYANWDQLFFVEPMVNSADTISIGVQAFHCRLCVADLNFIIEIYRF